jgi:hypothetical protein
MIMPAESSSPTRRSILATTAAAGAASLLNTNVDTAAEGDAIRPFRVNIPEAELTELRTQIVKQRVFLMPPTQVRQSDRIETMSAFGQSRHPWLHRTCPLFG